MAEGDRAEWVQWETFISDYTESKVSRDQSPPIPAVIQVFLDREDVKTGQLVPKPVAVDAQRPHGPQEVSRAQIACWKA
jgi:hypothetical protein